MEAGLAGIVAAIRAGMGFTGSGSSGASLVMSLACAVSLGCYVALVFVLAPAGRASTTT